VSNLHLNADQLAAWLAGDRSAEASAHLQGCAVCQAEVTSFESAIVSFRSGVHAAAERPRPAIWGTPQPRFSLRAAPAWGWALAAACAAVLAVSPFYQAGPEPQDERRPTPVATAELSDSALFEQMNAQLARSVPRSMEPLAALAWNANDIEANTAATKGIQ
jgi:hypothetical protein